MPVVEIYTDGACLNNPGPGGYGAVLIYNRQKKEISRGVPDTTNNRMELSAIIAGLEALKFPCKVIIHTDSQYISKAINQGWLGKWQKNGWQTSAKTNVKNRDLWEKLQSLMDRHRVTFRWIKGHSGVKYNERCDALAREAARQTAKDYGKN